MRILNRILKFVGIVLLGGCSIASIFEKAPPSVITTESIFLDTNPDTASAFIISDSIVPNLQENIANALEKSNVKMAQNYSSANVVVKVKTRFSGKVLKKDLPKLLEDEASFSSVANLEIKEKPQNIPENTSMIDRLIEDPSGMIVGFAVGSAISNPIVFAPIGMIVGSALNFGIGSAFSQTHYVTILDVEIHEKAQKPIWYTEKKIHKKDEYSVRKYEYSEQTNWKIYKTRIIANGTAKNLHKHIVALVL